MILIRRRKIHGDLWFEIVDGPKGLIGWHVNYRVLLEVVKRGYVVKDYDAIRLEMARWN